MKTKSVYHYCSPEVFNLIIRNRTIRLSNLDKTNDYMEKEWGARLIEKVLNDELKRQGIKIDLREPYFYSDDCRCHLEYLMNDFMYQKKKQTLIACLSFKNDDLGQWRAYGQDGFGLAIGFDYAKMGRMFNVNSCVSMKKVIYKKENQENELVNHAIIPSINYMRSLFDNYTFRTTNDYSKYFEDEFDTFTEVVQEPLAEAVSYIKNPAFEAENEVRLIYHTKIGNCVEGLNEILDVYNRDQIIGSKKQFVLKPVNFQFRNNKLISYADLSFDNMVESNIITEIVIGPKSKIREEDLYYYMIANGYGMDVSVRRSSASYR